ncbi:MAG: cobalamin biosynthesis protein P47K [Actinobacteria bacterium]|nr:cobalamin biosynthesis protein P47K [Actinomycetota bacterium]MDI6830703.1 GTP-binding protein [Actinomycetota bacterium]
MKLIIVSGFLGSGKTTFLLGLAKRLAGEDGLDFVILENEAGEVSIDGSYLVGQGLRVRELFSGCVCCQLAGDLVVSMREIKADLDPAGVILEASGLARVESILDTLGKYYRELEAPLVISLADLERSELYLEVPMPFVINQLKHADIVLLNKADRGDTGLLEATENRLREINPRAEVVRVSALDGTNLDVAAERVRAWMLRTS